MGTEIQKNADYSGITNARKELMESARKIVKAHRESSPYAPQKQGEFIERLEKYIEDCKEKKEPLTIAGFILAAGIHRRMWYKLKDGEYDAGLEEYKLACGIPQDAEEWVTEDGEVMTFKPWSEIVDHCYMLVQQERELGCVAGKAGNVIGNVFLLKAQHGFSDQPEQVQNQKNIQIIADAETAKKALEMLK